MMSAHWFENIPHNIGKISWLHLHPNTFLWQSIIGGCRWMHMRYIEMFAIGFSQKYKKCSTKNYYTWIFMKKYKKCDKQIITLIFTKKTYNATNATQEVITFGSSQKVERVQSWPEEPPASRGPEGPSTSSRSYTRVWHTYKLQFCSLISELHSSVS